MMSHATPSASPATGGAREDPVRARRGMWIATACALAAAASAVAPVAIILTTLEYDFDNGLLAPLAPVWRPAALLVFALVWPVPVLSGRPVARWGAVAGLTMGAAWLLFLAELDPRWLRAALVTAVCWAGSAFALAVPPSVGAFVRFQREHARSLARHLGTLTTESDARRWISVARAWEQAGVLSRRDRSRMHAALRAWAEGWAEGQATLDADLPQAIDALAPSPRGRLWGLPGRLLRRRRDATAQSGG